MDFLQNKYFLIALTFGFYLGAQLLQWRTGIKLLNPILIAIAAMIAFLLLCDIDYDTYKQGGDYIDFWLKPAVVALGVPLYKQLSAIKRQLLPLLLSELAGCVAGVAAHMLGCVLMLALFQLDPAEYATLLPKSITTAIGKGLSEELGGYPAITMVTIMITGLFGAVAAPALLRLMRVTEPLAQGLAIGTSSHAAGTSRAVELGDVQGAASSLAIVVTGLLTVIAAPLFAMLA